MSLRQLIQKCFSAKPQDMPVSTTTPRKSDEAYRSLLEITPAQELDYLRDMLEARYRALKSFDAEMRLRISRLHEPPEKSPIEPAQIRDLKEMKERFGFMLDLHAFSEGEKYPNRPNYSIQIAAAEMQMTGIVEQSQTILEGIQELRAVLNSFEFDNVTLNPLKTQNYRRTLTKLILTNLYGKDALLDLYPEDRRTLKEITRDMKKYGFT